MVSGFTSYSKAIFPVISSELVVKLSQPKKKLALHVVTSSSVYLIPVISLETSDIAYVV